MDEILNFGTFWNESGIRSHKQEILRCTKEIGGLFSRAYRYLRAAYSIYEDSKAIYTEALDSGKFNGLCRALTAEIIGEYTVSDKEGTQRSLFASAMTPNGLTNFLDSVINVENVYELSGGMGTVEEKLLEKLRVAAVECGMKVEAFYCALNPYKLEHLVIPELNTAVTTGNSYHSLKAEGKKVINMMDYYNTDTISLKEEDLIQNQARFEELLSIALSTIKRAKILHDHLETFYVPNINFNAINECYKSVMEEILV